MVDEGHVRTFSHGSSHASLSFLFEELRPFLAMEALKSSNSFLLDSHL